MTRRIKPGVRIFGIRSELLFALDVADQVYAELGAELVITSITDGKHSDTSLHYAGCAADLRTRNLTPGQAELARQRIKERLGVDYDVILEADHIHLEFQPRRRE